MNDIQREVKLRRLTSWIGTSPASVKIMGKVRYLPWTVEKNDHYFCLVIEAIPSTPSTLIIPSTVEDERQYTCGTPRLLESFGWILPRFENITNINILDGNSRSLICELYWRVDVNKFHNWQTRKKRLPSSASIANGVWRIFKNKIAERILMTSKENKAMYKKLCTREYKSYGRSAKQYRKEHKNDPVAPDTSLFGSTSV